MTLVNSLHKLMGIYCMVHYWAFYFSTGILLILAVSYGGWRVKGWNDRCRLSVWNCSMESSRFTNIFLLLAAGVNFDLFIPLLQTNSYTWYVHWCI